MKKEEWIDDYKSMITSAETTPFKFSLFLKEIIPSTLYKYTGYLDQLESTVLRNELCLMSPMNFNDPFDCRVRFEPKEIKKFIKSKLINKNASIPQLQKEMEALKEVIRKPGRITCFTENENSMLMWSHYANYHRGICIENDLSNCKKEVSGFICPVIYTEQYYDATDTLIKNEAKLCDFIPIFSYKGSNWAYEKEWRYFNLEGDYQPKNVVSKSEDRTIIKFQAPIRAIYLGVNFHLNQNSEKLKKDLKRWSKEQGFQLYQMECDSDLYRLNSIDIQ